MSKNKLSDSTINNGRRDLLLGATAISAALASGTTFAAADEHKHHYHAGASNTALIDAALDCIKKADACSAHCIVLVKQGDTSIAECLSSVAETLPTCRALAALASSESKHLKALAKVCIDICQDCYDQCEKHQEHVECKECMDSCAVCIDECKKILA